MFGFREGRGRGAAAGERAWAAEIITGAHRSCLRFSFFIAMKRALLLILSAVEAAAAAAAEATAAVAAVAAVAHGGKRWSRYRKTRQRIE